VSETNFEAYRANGRIFDQAAIYRQDDRNFTGAGNAERVSVISSTSGLFEMLGARVAIGRGFCAGGLASGSQQRHHPELCAVHSPVRRESRDYRADDSAG
jgi:hypothetical protein